MRKRENKCFCQRHKHEKEKIIVSVNDISMEKVNFYASERLRKTKWSFFVLLSDSERPNGVFSCFWATHKDQMEFFRASEWLRKTKWSFFVLLSDSERLNGVFSCFWATQKHKRGVSEWLFLSFFAFIRRNAMLITRHFFFWNKTNLFQIGFEVLIEVNW